MHDALHPGHRAFDLRKIGEVGLHECLVAGEVGRPANVAPPQLRVEAPEQHAQARAYSTGRTGHQDCSHCPSLQFREKASLLADLGGQLLIALSAVEQVPSHGSARLRR